MLTRSARCSSLTARRRLLNTPCDAQSPKVMPRRPAQGRGPSRISVELPSIPGLADAGLGLTEGALPDSADAEASSSDAAPLSRAASQNGKLGIREEHLPNSHIRVEVTMPPDFLKKAQQKALKQLRTDASDIPGFRKGKKVCSPAVRAQPQACSDLSLPLMLPSSYQFYFVLMSASKDFGCPCRSQTG